MTDINKIPARDQIVCIMKRMYQQKLTSLSGGNLSIYDAENNFWITPTAVDKGNLTSDDIVMFNERGEFSGNQRPSSEYPFHWGIYKKRNDICAIVHAHSPALIAFSIAGKVPNPRITPVSFQTCGEIGFAEYASPGSQELGYAIAEVFGRGFNIVILENHGVVSAGMNLIKAYERMETLEYTARTLIYAKSLGEVKWLQPGSTLESWMNPVFTGEMVPIQDASQDTSDIKKLLAKIVRRAYRQHLMVSTSGSASARLNRNDFVITPYGVDRNWLEADDLVIIQKQTRQSNNAPSRLVELHRAIYKKHKDVESIMTSQAPYVTAFAVTGTPIDTRSIPESYMLLRTIPQVSLADALQQPEEVAGLISRQSPALLIENLGILVTGENILHAFDRLEVVEFSARSLIEAKALGGLKPIDDQEIARLNFM
ncbi:MAG: hypothetical protein BGO78_11445 [Chloroflexi bacterium 44-23]|nr:MAG: hypothetical protein BGO78_11445 [Chloroflexi bacterium 44-23]